MQSALDIGALKLELLKSLEPETVCEIISRIVSSFTTPHAIAVVLWDADFEAFSDHHRYIFGTRAEEFGPAISLVTNDQFDWDGQNGANQPGLLVHKVMRNDEPVGVVIVAADKSLSADELTNHLSNYPLEAALAHCYEVSELKREVERLREQYELLEMDLEVVRRRAAMSGTSATGASPEKFRQELTDKEKLVYEISNAVRSSLNVEEVLQTAVDRIGSSESFRLSRCLVIWPMPETQDLSVYEYHAPEVSSVKHLFFTPEGEAFVKQANQKTALLNFSDDREQAAFDKAFLDQFGFLSGILVPLIYQDRNIGSLFLQDCTYPREWSIDNTALLGSLADLVTVAIEHANLHAEKKRQAVTDGLTGIANRRHFTDTLAKEFERARRYGDELSLVIVDMDFLKKINDTYGHHVGDEAIKAIGSVLGKSCRSIDLAARYGGEEFCLLLPDTGEIDALNLAERVRKLIEQTPVEGAGTITASIGVANYPLHCTEPDQLFEAADQALYAAKEGGRNRVISASSLPAKE